MRFGWVQGLRQTQVGPDLQNEKPTGFPVGLSVGLFVI
jgi:hypothetical protein